MTIEITKDISHLPPAPVPERAIGVEAVSMTKHFGEFTALDEVSLKVPAGTFHALLGENGAGKSTLVKCIMGYYRADAGGILVDGREQAIDNPRAAHARGLGMVYQHFTSVPAMTVTENFVVARAGEPGSGLPAVVDWRRETKELETFLARMPFRVPLAAKVSAISAGERQKCEILKQLYLQRRFLILDEPTSVLTPGEADEVLGMLRDMVRRGDLTVLMITHKFREVMAFADEVTILRRGRFAGAGRVCDLTPDAMAGMMIGAQELTKSPARIGKFGVPRLEVDRLSALDDAGQPALHDVSLTIRAGEIVGIAGVSGNGQRQLVEVLAGQREASGGEIRIAGESYHATRAEMRRHRLSCLPEEPLKNACVGRMSVADNLAFRDFDRPPLAAGGWWLQHGKFREQAERGIMSYGIKTRSPDTPIGELSGGNVQRTVLARELGGEVDVMIAANPCFGLDFAAVAQIHAEIIAVRNRGAAVLLVSEDLDELLELADRIVVIFSGRFVYEAGASDADPLDIGRHMAGHDAHTAA
jgi:general nucleoside transport system ATP-binding protein